MITVKSATNPPCQKCRGSRTRDNRGRLHCALCGGTALNIRRQKLKDAGLCHTCGRVSVAGTGHVYCESCRIRKRANGKRVRNTRPVHACKTCGATVADKLFRHCQKCLDKDRQAKATARTRGLCTACHKRPATLNYSSCERCRESRRNLRRSRAEAGICGYGSICSNPPAPNQLWCQFHLDRQSERTRLKHRKERERVIAAYGGCCACCGETEYEFLAVDHVHGNGSKETNGGRPLVKIVIEENFPSRFRMLCHNCNMARGLYGQCPHERQITALVLVKAA